NTPLTGDFGSPPVGTGQKQKSSEPIPWSEIGARAGGQYQGDGLAIVSAERGAVLRCVFQKLEGEAATEGLWLTSTAAEAVNDRFRVVAVLVGRECQSSAVGDEVTSLTSITDFEPEPPCVRSYNLKRAALPATGTV